MSDVLVKMGGHTAVVNNSKSRWLTTNFLPFTGGLCSFHWCHLGTHANRGSIATSTQNSGYAVVGGESMENQSPVPNYIHWEGMHLFISHFIDQSKPQGHPNIKGGWCLGRGENQGEWHPWMATAVNLLIYSLFCIQLVDIHPLFTKVPQSSLQCIIRLSRVHSHIFSGYE